jgi:hypothetical protein
MKEMTVIFFTKTDEIHILNKAVLYAHHNEHIDHIKLIHLYQEEDQIPRHLVENHYILDHLYPKIQIDLVSHFFLVAHIISILSKVPLCLILFLNYLPNSRSLQTLCLYGTSLLCLLIKLGVLESELSTRLESSKELE